MTIWAFYNKFLAMHIPMQVFYYVNSVIINLLLNYLYYINYNLILLKKISHICPYWRQRRGSWKWNGVNNLKSHNTNKAVRLYSMLLIKINSKTIAKKDFQKLILDTRASSKSFLLNSKMGLIQLEC